MRTDPDDLWHAPISFGNLVRQMRLERGWTQEELASRSGLNVTTVSNLERGATQRLFTDTIDRFAVAFQVPPEVLDPRRLGDAVAEKALSLRRREAIEALLRLPEGQVAEIIEVLEQRIDAERKRSRKRR